MGWWRNLDTLNYEIYQGTQRTEIEIQDLKINTGIPDSEFVFNVPEGAEVVTMNFEDMLNENISDERIDVPADGEKEKSIVPIVWTNIVFIWI